jgi:hypothetical protein
MIDSNYYKDKVSGLVDRVSSSFGGMTISYFFDFIFPRPMDKSRLLKALVDYGLELPTYSVDGGSFVGTSRMTMFVPDHVLAEIDPDSKDTFLKLQRLRRRHFIQRLRRVTVDGVSGVRMSPNWELIYDRLSEEYARVQAPRKAAVA